MAEQQYVIISSTPKINNLITNYLLENKNNLELNNIIIRTGHYSQPVIKVSNLDISDVANLEEKIISYLEKNNTKEKSINIYLLTLNNTSDNFDIKDTKSSKIVSKGSLEELDNKLKQLGIQEIPFEKVKKV